MFEKEAVEQANKKYPVPRVSNELDFARNRKYEEGFKEGSKFGYNKANEWHYPSKGEYPKETDLLMSKTLLLVVKIKDSECLSLALGKYNFSTQEFSYQQIVGLTDVIAWKEIVLPELKEGE